MFSATTRNESLRAHFQELTTFHLWAVTRLADWLRSKPAGLQEARALSSFPGIKATLLHMVEAEREWMGHLGVRPGLLQQGLEDELEVVLDWLITQARMLQEYVRGLEAEALEETCHCHVLLEGVIGVSRMDLLQHCLLHSTYHRGQLVTIGHQLGMKDAPMTDYLYYCLKIRKGEKTTDNGGRRREHYFGEAGVHQRQPFLAINFFSK